MKRIVMIVAVIAMAAVFSGCCGMCPKQAGAACDKKDKAACSKLDKAACSEKEKAACAKQGKACGKGGAVCDKKAL